MSNKSELIVELETGIFKRIEFLKSGKYFIAKNGRVLSLNSGEPKELALRLNAARIFIIVLYVPALKSFNVARLILRVFVGEPDDNSLVPEYIDGDSENLCLENLRWGKSDNTITTETARTIELASNLLNSRTDIQTSQSHVVNMSLKNKIINALIQIVTVTLKVKVDPGDSTSLILLINEITRIVNSNIIVNDTFHNALPNDLKDKHLLNIVKELKNDVETNISLYRGGRQ